MTKGRALRGYHIRWEPAEWQKVATMAVHLIDKQQLSAEDALWNAHRAVLPEHRWQERTTIKRLSSTNSHGEVWRKYASVAALMTAEQREAILQQEIKSPAPSKKHLAAIAAAQAKEAAKTERSEKIAQRVATFKANHEAEIAQRIANGELAHHKFNKGAPPYRPVVAPGTAIRWTKRELAFLARAAEWTHQQYPESKLWEQVVYAQQILGPDVVRPRAISGIKQSQYKAKYGVPTLLELMQQGKNDAWLIESIPFVPPGSEPAAPPPAPDDVAAIAAPVPEPAEAPPSAAPAQPATVAPPAAHSTIAEASKAFAETMLGALDKLLTTHSRVLLDEVNQRIAESSVRMGAQVAAMVQDGMQQAVHQFMQIELGGPITPPPAPPAVSPTADKPAEPLGAPESMAQRARLKVDVIGVLNPIMRNQVRDQFTKGVDIRFFDGDHHTRYKPAEGRHVIFLSKRSSHGTFDKLKKYGVKPIYVEPSTNLINHAIEELQRSTHQ